MRLAPGISSGVGDWWDHCTVRSGPIITSARCADAVLLDVDAVGLGDLALGVEVGQQRDRHAEVLLEGLVGEGRVDGDAEQLAPLLLELAQHLLVDVQLVGAGRG